MNKPTITLAKEIQNSLGLRGAHIVWIGKDGFTMAHTDSERASGVDLEQCLLHRALSKLDSRLIRSGYDIGWYKFEVYKFEVGGECLYKAMPIDGPLAEHKTINVEIISVEVPE
jgi:hypothetical protein